MGRKRKRSGRGKMNIRVLPIAGAIYAASELGWFNALSNVAAGDYNSAITNIRANFTAPKAIKAAGAVILPKMGREMFGPCNMARFGRVNVSLF